MTNEDRVEDLLSIYFAGSEVGCPPNLDGLCRDCPELLSELRDRIAAVEQMNRFVREANQPSAAPAEFTDADFPRRLGEYAVRSVLGRGGMGVVLLADDTTLGRQVAVKVMLPRLVANAHARDRFLREARAAAAIHHDHVVPIHHVGEDCGIPYLVMPLLQGEALDARLKREGTLPPAEVVRIGRETAEGLAAAHANGVVHRDVKPANLWLEAPNSRVKVLDFGLAQADDGQGVITCVGGAFGTPAFMSPEQVDGKDVDARADLFSLGATLYQAATGAIAFQRSALILVLRAVSECDPPPPRQLNPAVPPALSDLIMRLLAKSPGDRPPSARAVATELARLVEPGEHIPAAPRPRKWRAALALGSALLLSGGSAVWTAARPNGLPPGPAADADGGAASAPPAVVEPLRVVALDVHHFEKIGPDRAVSQGSLGQRATRPKLGDQVTLSARLSRPAYAYLVGFRPDGHIDLLSDDRPDRKVEIVRYPGPVRNEADDVRYGLTDGTGLYVFAVVASDAPLPPFAAVTAGTNWAPRPAAAGEVYAYDGEMIEPLVRGGELVRGERGPGEKALGASGSVVRAGAGLLKSVPGGRVTAVGFGVGEAKH